MTRSVAAAIPVTTSLRPVVRIVPRWYAGCQARGESDDELAYWCRRACEAVDAGETELRVTMPEYMALRRVLDAEPPARTAGPPDDALPVVVVMRR